MKENRKKLKFFPCNINGLIDISEDISNDEEIIAYITKNQFDSLEISWSGIFLHSIYHYLKTVDWRNYGEIKNSILFCALDNQTMQLMWILFSLCHGQYDLALRELRNIIENAFHCYRIDCQAHTKLLSGINKNSTSIIFLIRTVQLRRYCKEEFEKYKINNQKHLDITQ